MVIFESIFKGHLSVVLENDLLRAEIVMKGGRVVSLINKVKDKELLVQQISEKYCTGSYDTKMVDYQPAGFDDMFPTINSCFYEDFPWQGHRMPDHGEVWSLNWNCTIRNDKAIFDVHGVRLPYHLQKSFILNSNILNVNYSLENLSEFDMDFIWAAHPMLRAEEGLQVILPDDCNEAVCTLCFDGRLGEYGDIFTWPTLNNNNIDRINILRNLNARNTEKYYFKSKLKQGKCTILYPSDNTKVILSFPVDKVPYLGVLIEEGGWADELYIIPEPCTAPFDRIDIAKVHGKESIIKAKSLYDWFLEIAVH